MLPWRDLTQRSPAGACHHRTITEAELEIIMKATTTTEDGAIHQEGSLPRGISDPGDLLPLSKEATTREGDTTFHWRHIADIEKT